MQAKEQKLPTTNVKQLDGLTFEVTVDGSSSTIHIVTVQPQYANKLTIGRISTSQLVKYSFEFLLERESNTSIMRTFDLSVIARYFPEYENAIKNSSY